MGIELATQQDSLDDFSTESRQLRSMTFNLHYKFEAIIVTFDAVLCLSMGLSSSSISSFVLFCDKDDWGISEFFSSLK